MKKYIILFLCCLIIFILNRLFLSRREGFSWNSVGNLTAPHSIQKKIPSNDLIKGCYYYYPTQPTKKIYSAGPKKGKSCTKDYSESSGNWLSGTQTHTYYCKPVCPNYGTWVRDSPGTKGINTEWHTNPILCLYNRRKDHNDYCSSNVQMHFVENSPIFKPDGQFYDHKGYTIHKSPLICQHKNYNYLLRYNNPNYYRGDFCIEETTTKDLLDENGKNWNNIEQYIANNKFLCPENNMSISDIAGVTMEQISASTQTCVYKVGDGTYAPTRVVDDTLNINNTEYFNYIIKLSREKEERDRIGFWPPLSDPTKLTTTTKPTTTKPNTTKPPLKECPTSCTDTIKKCIDIGYSISGCTNYAREGRLCEKRTLACDPTNIITNLGKSPIPSCDPKSCKENFIKCLDFNSYWKYVRSANTLINTSSGSYNTCKTAAQVGKVCGASYYTKESQNDFSGKVCIIKDDDDFVTKIGKISQKIAATTTVSVKQYSVCPSKCITNYNNCRYIGHTPDVCFEQAKNGTLCPNLNCEFSSMMLYEMRSNLIPCQPDCEPNLIKCIKGRENGQNTQEYCKKQAQLGKLCFEKNGNIALKCKVNGDIPLPATTTPSTTPPYTLTTGVCDNCNNILEVKNTGGLIKCLDVCKKEDKCLSVTYDVGTSERKKTGNVWGLNFCRFHYADKFPSWKINNTEKEFLASLNTVDNPAKFVRAQWNQDFKPDKTDYCIVRNIKGQGTAGYKCYNLDKTQPQPTTTSTTTTRPPTTTQKLTVPTDPGCYFMFPNECWEEDRIKAIYKNNKWMLFKPTTNPIERYENDSFVTYGKLKNIETKEQCEIQKKEYVYLCKNKDIKMKFNPYPTTTPLPTTTTTRPTTTTSGNTCFNIFYGPKVDEEGSFIDLTEDQKNEFTKYKLKWSTTPTSFDYINYITQGEKKIRRDNYTIEKCKQEAINNNFNIFSFDTENKYCEIRLLHKSTLSYFKNKNTKNRTISPTPWIHGSMHINSNKISDVSERCLDYTGKTTSYDGKMTSYDTVVLNITPTDKKLYKL